RPDITVFINGLPLAFYEVKKPNSKEQMKAERDRMTHRNAQSCFRRYMNITQLMLFSGNQEYMDGNRWQGNFYCTTSHGEPHFNFLREKPEVAFTPSQWHKPNEDTIRTILRDTKLSGYEHTPEFPASIDPQRPAARFATSLLSRERLAFMLHFGIAYVKSKNATHPEKHIMRYPQLFASLRLRQWLDAGNTRGTIWHTQGSGKTALVYYSVKNLTDYYGKQGIVPKFFFVVDRIDLARQAADELSARGLHIVRAESRGEFDKLLRSQSGKDGKEGQDEINVINIQRFKSDGGKIIAPYGTNIKRIFFIDEAHRSYKPKGSFLGALLNAEADSIYIGLTGTPKLASPEPEETREAFLKREKATREIFGGYIDTYYYNQSIQDGYTLRLLHEVVETQYRVILEDALKQVKILVGDAKKRKVLYAHRRFVTPLTQYIVTDLLNAREIHGDRSIGGMVVCDTSEQARAMMKVLAEKHPEIKAALILHDEGTEEERKILTDQFRNGDLDLLVVFNMLLTGFDAPRLKKLYMGRIVKEHNLLQTLARVNRPYGDWKYGHVVDFADIRKAFDAANAAYLEELKKELGGDWSSYDALFRTREEIQASIDKMKDYLWRYCPDNLAIFEQLLDTADKKELQQLRRTLAEARALRASIIGGGYDMS
ncbi:MAG: DEAD/DEAH box helicase family protein, partial [Akkermansia sp.]